MRVVPLFFGLVAVVALAAAMLELRKLNAVVAANTIEIATLRIKHEQAEKPRVLIKTVVRRDHVKAKRGKKSEDMPSAAAADVADLHISKLPTGCKEEAWCVPNLSQATRERCKRWKSQCPCTCGGGIMPPTAKAARPKLAFTPALEINVVSQDDIRASTSASRKLLNNTSPETVVLTVTNDKRVAKRMGRGDKSVDIVVARCDEDLNWLHREWLPNVPRGFVVRALHLYLKCCPYPLPRPPTSSGGGGGKSGEGGEPNLNLQDDNAEEAIRAVLEAGVQRVEVVCVMNVGTEVGGERCM
jgi:hypothetical protein